MLKRQQRRALDAEEERQPYNNHTDQVIHDAVDKREDEAHAILLRFM
jgi:hypothetical protein